MIGFLSEAAFGVVDLSGGVFFSAGFLSGYLSAPLLGLYFPC